MSSKMGLVSGTASAVNATVTPALSHTPAATLFRTPFSSPAPNRWAVRIDRPEVSPMANPKIKNVILPVHPTAASAFTPMVLPTIKVSAIL